MSILSLSDFNAGKYELHRGMYDNAKFQNYIDIFEKRYLIQLLGVELYNEFDADLIAGGGTPTEQRFIDIFNELNFDYAHCIYQSEGIKEMLKGFIYYEIVADEINQMTPVGNVLPQGENSERATTLYTTFYSRYNMAVKTYEAIQKHIWLNRDQYDKFNGKPKGFAYWI
jgi:hypothetical protein